MSFPEDMVRERCGDCCMRSIGGPCGGSSIHICGSSRCLVVAQGALAVVDSAHDVIGSTFLEL